MVWVDRTTTSQPGWKHSGVSGCIKYICDMRLPEIDPAKGHVQVFDGHFRVYMRNPHEGATEIPYTPDTLPEAVTQVLLLVG